MVEGGIRGLGSTGAMWWNDGIRDSVLLVQRDGDEEEWNGMWLLALVI
jgi:hypothetical protein